MPRAIDERVAGRRDLQSVGAAAAMLIAVPLISKLFFDAASGRSRVIPMTDRRERLPP